MRIIAGTARGRTIVAPAGSSTRPTTDRVREAAMSSVLSCTGGFEDLVVCDAFAGSGALGLEAISRGADTAVLCDADKAVCRVLRRNVEGLGFGDRARIVCQDVLAHGLPVAVRPYGVVFLDPPYATAPDRIADMLARAGRAGQLAEDCLIVYEHDERVGTEDIDALCAHAELDRIRTKRYGQTILDYLRTAS